ncbi:MAG: cold-shock protein [Rhizobiales bacterium]|nr:cold-shock protein [Hyphomicrobiales bacterium]
MDKSATKGLRPGDGSGAVKSYNAKRNPFGGYITDSASGVDVFVHKSAVEAAGMAKLEAGQQLSYRIVEDGFGGFKAVELKSA